MSVTETIQRWLRFILIPLSSVADRLGNRYYSLLAVVLAIATTVVLYGGYAEQMRNKAYDVLIKNRLVVPAPDPDIVIVDIDETSLAAMAEEYGRWPWPRHIMGETIEALMAQKPKAVVFDITFAYPDVFNVESDKFLRETVARHPNTFFPLIRMNHEDDAQSELKISRIPGVTPLEKGAPAEATIAAVTPFFMDAIKGAQVGTNNLLTDDDGILRRYPVFEAEYGWRLNSLPAAVALALGAESPERGEILLNWRGCELAYPHIPFFELYADTQQREKKRPKDEFAGKIVIIGSTAPALFDYKATSVARTHPGVEILATAIDNLRNGDSLRTLPAWISLLVTILAIVLLAVAFIYSVDTKLVNLVFTSLQTGFLAVSYLILNFSTLFVDLTAPFAFSLAYFTLARLHGTVISNRRSGHALFSTALVPGSVCRVFLVQADVHVLSANGRLRLIGDIKRPLGASRRGVATPPLHKGIPLLYAFYKDTRLFYWLVPAAHGTEALTDLLTSLGRAVANTQKAARGYLRREKQLASFRLHTATVTIDEHDLWREDGAAALAGLHALAPPLDTSDKPTVHVLASGEFIAACREHPEISVPPVLAEAGLKVA
jgi:CHASE2 domain-containing sensor protein